MAFTPLLALDRVRKVYRTGLFRKRDVFQFQADFTIAKPTIVGMMGPNGSGKTTLLELIAGENSPTDGNVICCGRNIHKIKYDQRRSLAVHHFRASQKRRLKKKAVPNFLLKPAGNSVRSIQLYDEFETEDGFFGLLIRHFIKLHKNGHLVFLCIHPSKVLHLEVLKKICGQYLFIHKGTVTQMPDFETFIKDERVRDYLKEVPGDLDSV